MSFWRSTRFFWFVIIKCCARSATADWGASCAQLKQRCKEVAPGIVPSVEGLGTDSSSNSQWLVVDCGSVVAHVFEEGARELYDLDSMWGGQSMSLEAA